jgi:murein DD-endopeptidase MepM/ murein hydrolase activator NlpD
VAGHDAIAGIAPRAVKRLAALTCIVALLHPTLAGAGGRRKARVAKRTAPVKMTPEVPREPRPAGTRVPSGQNEQHLHVRRGETFSGILTARGVAPREAQTWVEAAAQVYDLRQLRPRRGLTLRFDRATRALETVRYEIDDRSLLLIERTRAGIRARRAVLPYFMEVKGVAGRIERGLREDVLDAGVPESIVSELADIFGWEVDVANGLRRGDEFRILYENIWETGGARPEAGKVLAAEITTRGRRITAVLFEDADGKGAYYRPNGEPVSREFLRYPVEYTEIRSDFSPLRRHPILRVSRPHFGVDFAAPAGTPVRAVGSGTVAQSGWAGQLGQCVRVSHPGALESTYAHLSRIAAGVKEGGVVERGQVIGYVGSTGLATGPHLHFAMHKDGEYVDTLAFTGSDAGPVPAVERRGFDRVRTAVTRQLAKLPATDNTLTVTLSPAALGTRLE